MKRALAVAVGLVLGVAAVLGAENDSSTSLGFPAISVARLSISLRPFASSSEGELENALAHSQAAENSKERMAAVLAGEASLYAAANLRGQQRVDYLEQAARDGDAAAASALGDMLDTGDGLAPDPERAFGYYRAGALGGRMEAAHNLGAAYATGRGVQRDFSAALAWLRVARERGDNSGEDERLLNYLRQLGRDDVLRKADERVEEWRAKRRREEVIAALPPATALAFLPEATDPENTAGDETDDKPPQIVVMTILGKRLSWPTLAHVERAANRGDIVAMDAMGRLLTNEKLLPRDPLGAVVWLERSAAGGDIDAAHQLGDLYSKGEGIVPDDAKAFAYFVQAAKGGSPLAMANVGVYFTNGRGTQRDVVKGLAWLIVAKQRGVDLGREARLRAFLAQHRPADLKKAEELSTTLQSEIELTGR